MLISVVIRCSLHICRSMSIISGSCSIKITPTALNIKTKIHSCALVIVISVAWSPSLQSDWQLQVGGSGNEALGVALFASMSHSSSRLGMRFRPSYLLHLLPSETILERVQKDPDLLFELSWRRMAIRRPDITVQLMRQALETAQGNVGLNKRWWLVRSWQLLTRSDCALTGLLSCVTGLAVLGSPMKAVIIAVRWWGWGYYLHKSTWMSEKALRRHAVPQNTMAMRLGPEPSSALVSRRCSETNPCSSSPSSSEAQPIPASIPFAYSHLHFHSQRQMDYTSQCTYTADCSRWPS